MRIYKIEIVIFILTVNSLCFANNLRCEELFLGRNQITALVKILKEQDASRDWVSVVATANQILETDPQNFEALNKKSKALFKLFRFEEALESLDRSLLIDPEHFPSLKLKSAILIQTSRFEESIQLLQLMLQQKPEDSSALGMLGEAQFNLGRWQEAIVALDAQLTISPDQLYSIRMIIEAHMKLEQYKEALPFIEKALLYKQGNYVFLQFKAYALFKLKQYSEFLIVTDKIKILNPKDTTFLKMRINAMMKLRRYAEALPEIEIWIQLEPSNTHAIIMKVLVLIKLKRFFEVGNLHSQIEDPYYKDYLKAQILIGLKQYQSAIHILNGMDSTVNVKWLLAQAYYLSGNMHNARLNLISIVQNSKALHSGAVAVLLKMQENGEQFLGLDGWISTLSSMISPAKWLRIIKIKDANFWDYEPSSETPQVSISNPIYEGLDCGRLVGVEPA